MKWMVMVLVSATMLWGFSGTAFAGHSKTRWNIDIKVSTGPHYPAPRHAAPPPVVYERVYVPPVYETHVTRVFVTDGFNYETRTEVSPSGQVRRITVKTPYGHYEERVTQVLVKEGYYTLVPVSTPVCIPAPPPRIYLGFRIGK